MRDSEHSQMSDEKRGTRFIWLSKYGNETGGDPDCNDTTGSMKNFPNAFIPMEELDESLHDQ